MRKHSRMNKKTFYIDDITECIVELATEAVLDTEMLPVATADLKAVTKKNGWDFTWKSFVSLPDVQVFKLIIASDPDQKI
jgi:hypothetical protein